MLKNGKCGKRGDWRNIGQVYETWVAWWNMGSVWNMGSLE